MMIQKHSCTGAFLSIDQPYVLAGQIFKSPNSERIFGSGYKSKVAIKKIDHDWFKIGEVSGEKRNIIFTAFRMEEMRPRNVRVAHIEGLETIRTARICRKNIK